LGIWNIEFVDEHVIKMIRSYLFSRIKNAKRLRSRPVLQQFIRKGQMGSSVDEPTPKMSDIMTSVIDPIYKDTVLFLGKDFTEIAYVQDCFTGKSPNYTSDDTRYGARDDRLFPRSSPTILHHYGAYTGTR
jgi:hypothetical protein